MRNAMSPMLAVLCLSAAAHAAPARFTKAEIEEARKRPEAYDLRNISVEIEKGEGPFEPKEAARPSLQPPPAEEGLDLVDIVNIGKKLWDIVKDNAPVVDVKTQFAAAVPKGIADWAQLGGWNVPAATSYAFVAKNLFGVEVVDVRYDVLRIFGGGYKGKGKYLSGVTVSPSVSVAWGYRFSMWVEVPDSGIINSGTTDEPRAGMMVYLHWTIATPLKESRGVSAYYVQGDGFFKEVGGPFKSARMKKAEAMVGRLRTDGF